MNREHRRARRREEARRERSRQRARRRLRVATASGLGMSLVTGTLGLAGLGAAAAAAGPAPKAPHLARPHLGGEVLTVTSADDTGGPPGPSGALTLRQAVAEADAYTAGPSTIEFQATLSGATIDLYEALYLDQAITIEGPAGGLTIEGPTGSAGSYDDFDITAGTPMDVTLSGLTIDVGPGGSSSPAVGVRAGGDGLTLDLDQVTISGSLTAGGPTENGVQMSSNGGGATLDIDGSTVTGLTDGLMTYSDTDTDLTGVTLSGNTYGLDQSGATTTISGSDFTDNQDGAYLIGLSSGSISGSDFEDNRADGLMSSRSSDLRISSAAASGNGGTGMYFFGGACGGTGQSGPYISGSDVTDNDQGIEIVGMIGPSIEGTTISGNTGAGVAGLTLKNDPGAEASGDTITGNAGDGIYYYGVYGLQISASTISGNAGLGVVFEGSPTGPKGTAPYPDAVEQSYVTGNAGGGVEASGLLAGQYASVRYSTIAHNDGPGLNLPDYGSVVGNSTVAYNSGAGIDQGASGSPSSVTEVYSDTIVDNSGVGFEAAGGATVVNSIISGSDGGAGPDLSYAATGPSPFSITYSLVGSSPTGGAVSSSAHDLYNVSPQLGSLTVTTPTGVGSGGPPRGVMEPSSSSPVIGAGSASTRMSADDEIGNPRTTEGVVDMGAIEVVGATAPTGPATIHPVGSPVAVTPPTTTLSPPTTTASAPTTVPPSTTTTSTPPTTTPTTTPPSPPTTAPAPPATPSPPASSSSTPTASAAPQTNSSTTPTAPSPVTGTQPASGPVSLGPASDQKPTVGLKLDFQTGDPAPGADLAVNGDALMPGSVAVVTLHSTPDVLGRLAVDANGNVDGSVSLPSHMASGLHHLEVSGTGSDGEPVSNIRWFQVSISLVFLRVQTSSVVPSWARPGNVVIGNDLLALFDPVHHSRQVATTEVSLIALGGLAGLSGGLAGGLTGGLAGGLGGGLAGGLSGGPDGGPTTPGGRAGASDGGLRDGEDGDDHEDEDGHAEGSGRGDDEHRSHKKSTSSSIGSTKVKHTTTRGAEEALGVRSRTWGWPGHQRLDVVSRSIPPKAAAFSPLAARLLNDGVYLRAMFGPLALAAPLVGMALGILAVASNQGLALPPSAPLLAAIVVLGVFDALAGSVAALTFIALTAAAGGIVSTLSLRTLLGVGVIFFVAPLAASAARPLRRKPAGDLGGRFDRMADMVVASLVAAWGLDKLVSGLPALCGLSVPVAHDAGAIALMVLGAVALRYALETVSMHWYPHRLAAVVPGDIPAPSRRQVIISGFCQTGLFIFVAMAALGNVWELYVGAALFFGPVLLGTFTDSLPNFPKLVRMMPKGTVKVVFMLVVGTAFAALVGALVRPAQLVTLGFVIFTIPGLLLGLIGMCAREGPKWPVDWKYRISGVAMVVLAVLLVRGVIAI